MNLEFYKGKNILITGAGGYIGSALTGALGNVECNLTLFFHDRKPELNPAKAKIASISGDITKPGIWGELLPGVDVVFHLVEHPYKEFSPEKELYTTAAPILRLLETARIKGYKPQIVFASSNNLVGLPSKLPVNENFPDNPITIFSIHKMLAEKYLEYYSREYAIPSIILRLTNVYGPVPDKKISERVVLNYMIAEALRAGKVKLFSNRDRTRDFVYIDDVVAAFLCAGMTEGKSDHFLIGSGEGKKLEEIGAIIADKVSKKIGKHPEIIIDEQAPISEIEKRNFVTDYSKFSSLTGWKPQILLDDGIENTLNYLLNK